MQKERLYYLDLLRFVAVCAVILIHASAPFVSHCEGTTIEFILGNIFDGISRLGVPLFLMISGALMLDERRDFRCRKSALRLLYIFLIWSFLYTVVFCVFLPYVRKEPIDLISVLSHFIRGHSHLWYMYAIIGLYLITPILRSFVKESNRKIVFYFILLCLVFQFTNPFIQLILNVLPFDNLSSESLRTYTYVFERLSPDFVGGLTVYYVTGWYIAHAELSKKNIALLCGAGLLGVISIVLLTQLFPDHYELMYAYESVLVFFYAVAVFLLVKKYYKPTEKKKQVFSFLSKYTFGIYLVHIFVWNIVEVLLGDNIFFVPLIALITFSLSLLICFILSKIPVLKKIIKT